MTTISRPSRPGPPPDGASSFTDALDLAAEVASHSPSSHNCQPWAIATLASPRARAAAADLLAGQPEPQMKYLALALDRSRQLDALPAHRLEMLLSCGLYWDLLGRALQALGWSRRQVRCADGTDGSSLPGISWPAGWTPLGVAAFARCAPDRRSFEELRETAQARRTNRLPYRAATIGQDLLSALARPQDPASGGAGVTVSHLQSSPERARLARFLARHGGRDFSHSRAWRETYSFIRWSADDAQARGDGFTPDSLFGPLSPGRRRLMRMALCPATMRLLSHAGYHRLLAGRLAELVSPSPAVVIMSVPQADIGVRDGLLCAARLNEFWLAATRAGLALHPISVLLQHAGLRAALQAEFGVPGRAFFLARLGYPMADCPATPRRPATYAMCRL